MTAKPKRDDDWTQWCAFFLAAITEQAIRNEQRTRQILDLYQARKDLVVGATHSQYSMAALDFLSDQPIFNASNFIQRSGIPAPTARRILRLLTKQGTLRQIREAAGTHPATYAFPERMNIAEGRKIF